MIDGEYKDAWLHMEYSPGEGRGIQLYGMSGPKRRNRGLKNLFFGKSKV